ncbi:MAG TPA: hypothetical protein DEB63_12165 [Agrobacterium sp.]|uniref:hypothetical protein n=1 Tax=Rhizobium TaxID=379 RepID=UPI000E9015BD|nr:hypothetical protein [Rhizobium sp. X9]HBT68843.1 hypothetical protein [Agrobacterium sp.]
MPSTRIFLILITLFFALPVIGGFVLNIAAATYLLQMVGLVRTVASVEEEEEFNDFNGIPINPRDAPGLPSLRNMEEFEKSRVVTIRVQMKPEDFRRGDRSGSAVTDWNGYIASRLPTIGLSECDLLTQTFAAKCAVIQITAEKSGSYYDLNMTLSFTQRDPFGSVQPSEALNYLEISANLNKTPEKTLLTDRWQVQRREYYAGVAVHCTRIRKENGNCAIYRIIIRSTPDRGSSAVKVTANSTFIVLR